VKQGLRHFALSQFPTPHRTKAGIEYHVLRAYSLQAQALGGLSSGRVARHIAETMSVFLKPSPLNRRGSPVILVSA
jgi:hypothetical protein